MIHKEIKIVNYLRGVASMMVFLFHLVCLSSGYISNKLVNEIARFGKYGVQLFFVISGYIIIYSLIKANYKTKYFFTFLKKRIIRIEPPYLITLIGIVLLLFLRNKLGLPNSDGIGLPNWKQFFLHIGYLIPFSNYSWLSIVFWTLAIEFQFYILFSLIIVYFIKYKWIRYGCSILLIMLSLYSTWDDHFIFWSPVFLLGIYLALFKTNKIGKYEFWTSILILTCFIFYKMEWKVLLFSIIAFISIYLEPNVKSRIGLFLGNISYSLYLCHTLIAFTIINLGIKYGNTFFLKSIFVFSAFFITILCSYFLYLFVEKPVKKIASSIKYNS